MARTGEVMSVRFNRVTRPSDPIPISHRVRLQNQQTGMWDRLGTVIDTPAPLQYLVRLHGSGRASLRNRRHLRPTSPDNPPGASLARDNQGDDLGDDSDDGAPTPPPPPARPRRTVRAPCYLSDYVSFPGLP
ncbi:hypothetical protein E2C01_060688 [Portunus trituberculatus]|uniref:Uncharacterized protein n=1 Tax=Portunus trituberculatus TaxID=210409 RepID=A0A5B7H9P8_PORTR|nr:hypothetical protein [Portunus trituberculatus]